MPKQSERFDDQERSAIYRVIAQRRDMRHFDGGQVDAAILERLLRAANHAPSVGLMQPWRIIRIADNTLRQQIHALVEQEVQATAIALKQRKQEFLRLKVEGIRDCAELLVFSLCDQREQHIFGRRTLPEMDLASVACAIQNMWLAARAENLGMGWVSLFDPQALSALLDIPVDAKPVAIICLGPVKQFYQQPMLEQYNWRQRTPLDELLYQDSWGQHGK